MAKKYPFKNVSGHVKHEEQSSFPLNSAKEDFSQSVSPARLHPLVEYSAATVAWRRGDKRKLNRMWLKWSHHE